jgi:DNA sulfur modification protein DndD
LNKDLVDHNKKFELVKQRHDQASVAQRTLRKRFLDMGGLSDSAKNDLESRINKGFKKREREQKIFRHFLEFEAAFYLNRKLILQADRQVMSELPIRYLDQIKEISGFLDTDEFQPAINRLETLIRSRNKIHDASLETHERLKAILSYRTRQTRLIRTRLSRQDDLKEIQIIQGQVKNHEMNDKITSFIKEMREIELNIADLQNQMTSVSAKIQKIRTELDFTYDRYEGIKRGLIEASSNENSFVLATKAIEINNAFMEKISERYRKMVSGVAIKKFIEVSSKQNIVGDMEISKDYDVIVYDKNKARVDMRTLSAGEKQLMLSSMIFAMVKVSRRNLFFVFDTPLARLDHKNRKRFIESIIKDISEQVIILSTDSEFVSQYLVPIDKSTVRRYLLDHTSASNSTRVIQGYFEEVHS